MFRALVLGLALGVVGCAEAVPTEVVSASAARTATRHKAARAARVASSVEEYAEFLYENGDEPGGNDDGLTERVKKSLRKVCLREQNDREMVLQQMRERAQINFFNWKEWHEKHCGKDLDDQYVCAVEGGPSKVYVRDAAEDLAVKQRDACERAQ